MKSAGVSFCEKMDQHQIIQQLEEHAENIIKKTRKYLPHIGRFCLISTFVEDGIRMINQWGEQRDYIGKSFRNLPIQLPPRFTDDQRGSLLQIQIWSVFSRIFSGRTVNFQAGPQPLERRFPKTMNFGGPFILPTYNSY